MSLNEFVPPEAASPREAREAELAWVLKERDRLNRRIQTLRNGIAAMECPFSEEDVIAVPDSKGLWAIVHIKWVPMHRYACEVTTISKRNGSLDNGTTTMFPERIEQAKLKGTVSDYTPDDD